MYRNRLTRALLVPTALSAFACGPDGLASPETGALLEATGLVRAPVLTQSDLSVTDTVLLTPAARDPSVGVSGPAPADVGEDPYDRPWPQIIEADSRGDFQPGFGGVFGTQKYIGNLGSVTTTAHLSYRDQHLGSFTAKRQQYTPFLADFGQVKHVWVFPKVYSDRECGLSVQGSSQHAAWWQFFQGSSVQTWGREERATQAPPYAQGACSQTTGEYEGQQSEPGGVVCTYWITYDLDTGEIISADLLYCSSTGGEVI